MIIGVFGEPIQSSQNHVHTLRIKRNLIRHIYQITKYDSRRRVSEILYSSNNNKTLLNHINVRSSTQIFGEKNESFSSRISSPLNFGTLEKKVINIDLKSLSSMSKKWNFQKEYGNINTLNYNNNNNSFVKKKLKFDESKNNQVL